MKATFNDNARPTESRKSKANRSRARSATRGSNSPVSIVGVGASAGGVQALQRFFSSMPHDSGLAFVVVMHLSPDHASNLAEILQSRTRMPVIQVTEAVKVERDRVYVIPPNKHLSMSDSMLVLSAPQQETGRRVAIDLFFRTLAKHYGQRAVCIILSGTDSDGVIGLKHIKAQGGVTIAQEPSEAQHDAMPRHAIETGMVDWILPVDEMPARLCDYVKNEEALTLPPEKDSDEDVETLPDLAEESGGGPLVAKETNDPDDENALAQVLVFLRTQTGHDFSHYKRATVLRRVARRLQVNSLDTLPAYLEFLRTHPGESRALLSDLLINVTNFFRDENVFGAISANVPQLFAGKGPNDHVRVWVPACATGEEAYSIAILLCEAANRLEKPPQVQIFATDVDEDAVRGAREGIFPLTIEADVSQERLRRYFFEYHGQYRIKKEVREQVLFATHDVLRDSPFSRLDLISCRNLLIYLKPEAQHRVLDIFHFGLRPGGLLVLGNAESVNGDHALFGSLDKQNRIYVRRNAARLPMVQLLTAPRSERTVKETVVPRLVVAPERGEIDEPAALSISSERQCLQTLSEMHARLIEENGPPSVIVDENYDIVHLSTRAGAYLRLTGGAPTPNLLKLADEALRLELRTALFRAGQSHEPIFVSGIQAQRDRGTQIIDLRVWPLRPNENETPLFLVMFDERAATEEETKRRSAPQPHEPVARHLEEELRKTRDRLNSTVEHYETNNEELKAANEELQAMNEEMRSAAEELETSKEELQSVNEELTTLNQELKSNIEEVHRANSDLQNLIGSTDIATIFLDADCRIKRYTPRTTELFNVIGSDIGRPLSDITGKLRYPELPQDAERVLNDLVKVQREVQADGHWFLARLSPYRTVGDKIDGVVLAFVDITEHKAAEDKAAAGAARLQRMMNVPQVGVLTFDYSGAMLHANDAFLEMVGHERTEFEAHIRSWRDFTPPEYVDDSLQIMDDLQSTGRGGPYEKEYFRKDGSRAWFMFVAADLGDGTIVEYVVDISASKRASKALREGEQRLRALVENLPGGAVFIVDCDLRYQLAAGEALVEAGFSEKDFVGRTISEALPADLARQYEPQYRRALAGETFEHEHEAHGHVYLSRGVPLTSGDGETNAVLAISYDITDRKHAEEAMRKSEERFRQFSENSADVFWILDAQTNQLEYVNTVYETMFGQSREVLLHDRSQRLALVPKEDRAEASRGLEEARAGKTFVRNYRIVRPNDGSTRWIRDTGFPIRDGRGKVVRIGGIAQDVTDERKRTEALQRSEDELRRVNDDLEQRVMERTRDLHAINVELERAMMERQQLEKELLEISEREKRRIGEDLHDLVCQELTATALFLRSAATRMSNEEGSVSAAETLEEAAQTVNRNVGITRDLARKFQPADLTGPGLKQALKALVAQAGEGTDIQCHFRADRGARVTDDTLALHLYRVAQEAVKNAVKHSKATNILVVLGRDEKYFCITVEDDGTGFAPRKRSKGLGLHLMRYRANALGGELTIKRRARGGTEVRCKIPIDR